MTSSGKIKVVFFGSGPVAARCLKLLLSHYSIEAVVTKPKPPHHKYEVPVLEVASQYNLPVITASNKQELDTAIANANLSSRVAILIDFGIIVSKNVIKAFPLGIVNSHFSLLPHLRGADPITFAILNGDQKTGVSLMLVDEGVDTGKLLTRQTLRIEPNDTATSLTGKLITLSDELLAHYLPLYVNGDIKPKNQPHPSRATYSRKLTKADSIIDWQQPASAIERKIRAHLEWPGSRTNLGNLEVIITSGRTVKKTGSPGSYIIDDDKLLIFASTGALAVETLKPIGKKEMPIQAFLAGYKHKL